MTSHKQICEEYLGDVDHELLLQNLTNINPHFNTIDNIREYLRVPFTVSAEYEYEWEGAPKTTKPIGNRFVRLVLEPLEGQAERRGSNGQGTQ